MAVTSTLPAETHIGPVSLTVADLQRQMAFHQERLGFSLLDHTDHEAMLGAGETPLLHLVEQRGALRPRVATGLYHTAILVPEQRDLGHLLRRIAEMRTPLQGMSDHGTHLALYLADAEGNGLELAWDRPTSEWPMANGTLAFITKPLDARALLNEAVRDDEPWERLPDGTRVGHIHLTVNDLGAARHFYHDILGFDVMADLQRMGAIFVSAGGYHHHIGANTWTGVGIPTLPADAQGLRYFTVVLPTHQALMALWQRLEAEGIAIEPRDEGLFVRDPSQNGVLLVVDK